MGLALDEQLKIRVELTGTLFTSVAFDVSVTKVGLSVKEIELE